MKNDKNLELKTTNKNNSNLNVPWLNTDKIAQNYIWPYIGRSIFVFF